MYIKKINGEQCYLSPVNRETSHLVAQWSNQMEIAIRTGDLSDMITTELQAEYLDGMNEGGYGFYIIPHNSDMPMVLHV